MARIAIITFLAAAIAHGASAQEAGDREKELDCVVQPNATVKLGSVEQGVVSEITADRGNVVRKGQIVARLDSRLQALAVELAEIRAESDVEIRSAKARLEFRTLDFERAGKLHQRQAMAAKKLEEAEIEKKLAELALETAILQQKQARVELLQAKERLERRAIRSSFDGVVVKLNVNPGEYVYEQVSILTVAAIDPLYVEVFVPLAYFGRIQLGTAADVKLEAPIGGTHRAKVTVIDRVFDAASRTFGVRLELPNPDLRLPAGLNCRIRFGIDFSRPAEAPPAQPEASGPPPQRTK
jgi:RND family efflux transporter MFP subunit